MKERITIKRQKLYIFCKVICLKCLQIIFLFLNMHPLNLICMPNMLKCNVCKVILLKCLQIIYLL